MSRSASHKKIIVAAVVLVLLALIVAAYFSYTKKSRAVSVIVPAKPVQTLPAKLPAKPVVSYVSITGTMYHTIKITSKDPVTELAVLVGSDNIQTVFEINRIDAADIPPGRVLVVPNSFDDLSALSPFPATLASAADIPKLMIVSLQMQAFAIYDSGTLTRWGGVNTGKQSTPTPDQLYFANWKGKSVISSEDDSWVLPWYVNLDNTRGVSMHQYALPGYPASHACIRMFNTDAEWVYNWVDQWHVSDDGETVLSHGTPVLIFGQYGYGETAPWKKLAKDPNAATLSPATLETIVSANKEAIFIKS